MTRAKDRPWFWPLIVCGPMVALSILALALGGCTAQHVIGIGYIAAQVAPRAPSRFVCHPPRIERQGICARPEAFGGKPNV